MVRVYFSILHFSLSGHHQYSVQIQGLIADGLLCREIRQITDALVALAPRNPSARTWTEALNRAMGQSQDPTGPAARLAWQIWAALGGSATPAGDTRLRDPAPRRLALELWQADRG